MNKVDASKIQIINKTVVSSGMEIKESARITLYMYLNYMLLT